jgi:hypothetical protein
MCVSGVVWQTKCALVPRRRDAHTLDAIVLARWQLFLRNDASRQTIETLMSRRT